MTSNGGTITRRASAEALPAPGAAAPAGRIRATASTASRCGALLLGGAHGSLSIARSLGRRGIPIWFVTDEHLIPKYSRYTLRTVSWGGPDHPDAASFLMALAERHRLEGWVLIPGGDAEVRLIAQNYGELSKIFRLVSPPWDVVRWAYDKRLTHRRADALGIAYPRSWYPGGRHDIAGLDCRFPLILKPTVRKGRNAFTLEKAWRVDDRAQLLRRYDQAVALVGEDAIVLQELIPGSGSAQFSYAAVWDRGAPVASLVANRARQFPVDFGYTSTCVRTLEAAPIEEAACRFLELLDYSGLVEVEFKHDARDGRTKLLDVNARTWTWNGLGSAAGVDFADVLWRLAMGETVAPLRGRAGAVWINLSRDLVAAAQEMLRGNLSAGDYVRSLRAPVVLAASAADDPLPGIVDLPLVLWRALTRRLPIMARGI